ncbi:hypothetical protein SAMN02787148_107207 [Burkholderia vietnamiensis]|nr:hypothetical protein EC918_10692 [Burkholderia vietnamiensis]SCZ29515.1 hypothetical protein SAMN02787148_107207 [Burkholderia vietnamiensis]SFX72005.1 hypothetical protein SAMN02787160_107208 [Burkholderia vietnamiensis]
MRIQRTLAAEERAAANEHHGLELQKYHDREASEFTAGDERVYERVDYNGHIDRLTRRLESLERTRVEMIDAQTKRDADRDDFEPVTEWRISVIGENGDFTRPDGTFGNVKNGDEPHA